jgi:hypothetical protein
MGDPKMGESNFKMQASDKAVRLVELAVNEVKKKSHRKVHLGGGGLLATDLAVEHKPSPRLDAVFAASETFLRAKTPATLEMLSVQVNSWMKSDKREFANCDGHELQEAISKVLHRVSHSPWDANLKNGDILFRYVPHLAPGNTWVKAWYGQRGMMQGKISAGQSDLQGRLGKYQSDKTTLRTTRQQTGVSEGQLREIFDTSTAGESADLIQHVGIYVEVGKGDRKLAGVVEIGLFGVYSKVYGKGDSMEKHGKETIDLVVRFVKPEVASQVGKNAYKAGTTNWENEFYPIVKDFKYMINTPSTCGVLPKAKLEEVKKAETKGHVSNFFIPANHGFKLAQRPVCSHFVHAILWASLEDGVTVNAATNKQFDQFFKISPFQLWNAFLNKQGVWAKAKANCVGIQQNGVVYPVTGDDLTDLKVAA